MSTAPTETTTCYRHPGRETRVSCSSCGRPICPDCMRPSPVGMRCPECSREKTKVRSLPALASATPYVTFGLIIMNVAVWLAEGGFRATGARGALVQDYALFGPLVSDGDWYRLVTYGFLHAGIIHIGFNMYILYLLGREMEPELGWPRFVAVYVVSLLGGAFGALLFDPRAVTVGASGAVFGLMGAAAAIQYARGVNPMHTGIGPLILLNLGLGFVIPNVSVGGHEGGLAAGTQIGLAFVEAQRRRVPALGWAAVVVVGAAAVVGAELVARSSFGGIGI